MRPGRTGFDPLEQKQEMARLQGMGFKYVFWGRYSRYATVVGFVALMTVLFLNEEFEAVAVIGAVAGAIGLLWRISHEHLMELRRRHRRTDMPFRTYDGDM